MARQLQRIRRFVDSLAAVASTPVLANPYSLEDRACDRPGAATIRRRNLELYLRKFLDSSSGEILVGEAAGYQGCRFSGIPFTSEHTLATHPFFNSGGFERSSMRARHFREPSGSIVWETIVQMPALPVLWNVVPFHPHKLGVALSNRMPLRGEQQFGIAFLAQLQSIFKTRRLIAVGEIAHRSLDLAGLPHSSVRHPSHGGKSAFQRGLLGSEK